MATYGSFPGVQVSTAGGGITSVAVGEEEYLVLFGEAGYQNDGSFDGDDDPLFTDSTTSTNEPTQINARSEADSAFGEDSELALAMREALANGANIDYLYGVAPTRKDVQAEEFTGASSGTLANSPIVEDTSNVTVTRDDGGSDTEQDVYFAHDGAPTISNGGSAEAVYINPHTGEWAGVNSDDYDFSYKYLDWSTAFDAASDVVGEDETGVFVALSEADSVATTLETDVSNLRDNYQLVTALHGAEPNDDETVTSDGQSLASGLSNLTRFDAQFDTSSYSAGSVDADYFYQFAPIRVEEDDIDNNRTILGGVGGLFAGSEIDDPVYNDVVNGYDNLEQSFSKSDEDNIRDAHVIPVRSDGSIRVKDNLSTSTEEDWERDFWRRRITDRVVLIAKTIGDTIIGDVNDEVTRNAAERQIEAEMRSLVDDRVLRRNTPDEDYWFVDVYESSSNSNEVKVDIGFTPYGVVKRIDASVTINT